MVLFFKKSAIAFLVEPLVLCGHVLIFRLLPSNGNTAILSRTAKRENTTFSRILNKYWAQMKEMHSYLIVL